MCGTCGCPDTAKADASPISIDVLENILHDNDETAARNRMLFDAHGVIAVNLMSSPGSGKTRLIEVTGENIEPSEIAVIEGDLETENDADRVRAKGIQAHQITTGMACHLDADMVSGGISKLDLQPAKFVFIENVGNLICPATFDLGQHRNVVLLSVTEGDDKPLKYPAMFRSADLVLISKVELLPFMDDFDIDRAEANIAAIQPNAEIIQISAKRDIGIGQWRSWLENQLMHRKTQDHV